MWPIRALIALVLSFSVTLGPLARAGYDGDCLPFRMDDPGGSMEHVKVRDQEGLGICFAETGAQVADAIRFSRLGDHNYDLQTSGAAAAVGVSNVLHFDALHSGGASCWSIKYINKYGICDQSSVEDAGLPGLDAVRSATLIENSAESVRPVAATDHRGAGCTNDGTPLPAATEISGTMYRRVLELTSDMRPTARETGAACAKTAPLNPFQRVDLSCEPFPTSAREGEKPTPAEYKAKLANLLQPNGLPVEIHYCANFLDHGGARSGGARSTESCSPHASLVIGRKPDPRTGKCQYLVRNSWGTECDHYADDVRPGCEEGKGNIWIDADLLTGKTLGIVPPPQITPRRL